MGSLNRVFLIGHLGAKPELKYLPSGVPVCEMRLATSERFKDKSGQQQEKTEWHRLKAWGKTGEHCAQYLDKGRQVYVEGRLETRTWDDKKTGEKRYATEVVVSSVVFLGSGGKKESAPAAESETETESDPGTGDDRIPF